jgi:hypothetical protein
MHACALSGHGIDWFTVQLAVLEMITGSFCFAFPCPSGSLLLLRFSKSSNFFEIYAKKTEPCSMPGTVHIPLIPLCPPVYFPIIAEIYLFLVYCG